MEGIGKRIDKLLDSTGLTPYQLSKKTSISQSTISRILKKDSKPNASNLKVLSVFFSVTEEWILTGEGEKEIKSNSDFILTKDNQELEIDKIVDIIFLHKEKFEANEKFKTYLSEKINKGINEFQAELLRDYKKKGTN